MNTLTTTDAPAQPSDLWTPRRALTLEHALNRSRMIARLRWVFVGAAVGAIATMVLWATVAGVASNFLIDSKLSGADAVRMIAPRFSGRDSDGQPVEITADAATRSAADPEIVLLENPVLITASGLRVQSQRGTYDARSRTLDLDTDVRIIEPSGTAFSTTVARIIVAENRVVGEQPISGRGPFGEIAAGRYEIFERGDRVVFSGGVRTMIEPAGRRAGNLDATDGRPETRTEGEAPQ